MSLIRLCAIALSGGLLATATTATVSAPQSAAVNDALAQAADNASAVPRLPPLEAAVLREINRARTNPNAYADWLERQRRYYDGNVLRLPRQAPIPTQEGVAALDEAIRFLRQARPLLPLQPSSGLSLGLSDLLADRPGQPTTATTEDFLRSIGRYGSASGPVALNLSTDRATPSSIAMQLVLDDGNPNRDRRATLFNIDYRTAGVACRLTGTSEQPVCALAYAGDYTEDANLLANFAPAPRPAATPSPEPSPLPMPAPSPTPPVATAPAPPTRWLMVEQGILEDGDPIFPQDGTLYDEHLFRGTAGQSITVRLESSEFDTFLAIFDEQGNLIAQNDDTDASDSNSTLALALPYTGVYRIFVNGYNPGDRGRYTLTIR